MNNNDYNRYIENRSHRSHCISNCFKAFFTGGVICCLGEAVSALSSNFCTDPTSSRLVASIFLIFASGLLTGIGVFDKIAKFGGGGALVPITGFSNSVASPAIDSKTEGWITGVGAKMFGIAGPVILYGTVSSVVAGLFYWLINI